MCLQFFSNINKIYLKQFKIPLYVYFVILRRIQQGQQATKVKIQNRIFSSKSPGTGYLTILIIAMRQGFFDKSFSCLNLKTVFPKVRYFFCKLNGDTKFSWYYQSAINEQFAQFRTDPPWQNHAIFFCQQRIFNPQILL